MSDEKPHEHDIECCVASCKRDDCPSLCHEYVPMYLCGEPVTPKQGAYLEGLIKRNDELARIEQSAKDEAYVTGCRIEALERRLKESRNTSAQFAIVGAIFAALYLYEVFWRHS